MPATDGFLNIDLELGARTRTALAPLLAALDGELFELFRGRLGGQYRAHYELAGGARDATATLRALLAVIEGLPPSARRAWDRAARRDFNVGVELARGVRSVELAIDADAIRRVAALGGRLAFTAYQVAALTRARTPRVARKPR